MASFTVGPPMRRRLVMVATPARSIGFVEAESNIARRTPCSARANGLLALAVKSSNGHYRKAIS